MYREHMPTLPRSSRKANEDRNSQIDQSSIYDRPGGKFGFQKFVFRGHKQRWTDSAPSHRCDMCEKGITEGDFVHAMPFYYHQECCRCCKCGKDLGGDEAIYKANKNLYCDDCHEPFCNLCGTEIQAGQGFVKYLEKIVHKRCFVCQTCGVKLNVNQFYLDGEKPMCEEHGGYEDE